MRRFRSRPKGAAEIALILLGILGVLFGSAILLFSVLVIAPRVSDAALQLDRNLQAGERFLDSSEQTRNLERTRAETLQSGARLASTLPETLSTLRGTLLEGAAGLTASAQTVQETQQGLAGAVLPKEPMRATAGRFDKTAEQMRLSAGMLEELRNSMITFSNNLNRFSSETNQSVTRADSQEVVPVLRKDLSQFRAGLNGIWPRWIPIALGALIGSIYLLLGFIALALGMSLRNSRRQTLTQLGYITGTNEFRPAA